MKLSLSAKVIGLFALFTSIILLALWFNLLMTSRVVEEVESVVVKVEDMRSVSEVRGLFNKQVIVLTEHMVFGGKKHQVEFAALGVELSGRLERLGMVFKGPAGSPGVLEDIVENYRQYEELGREVIRLHESGRKAEAYALEWEGLHPFESAIDDGFERLLALESDDVDSVMGAVRRLKRYGAVMVPVGDVADMAEDIFRDSMGLQVLFSAQVAFLRQVDDLTHIFAAGGGEDSGMFEADGRVFEERLLAYHAFTKNLGESTLVEEALKGHAEFTGGFRAGVRELKAGRTASAHAIQNDRIDPAEDIIDALLESQVSVDVNDVEELAEHIRIADSMILATTRYLAVNITIIFSLFGIFLFFMLNRTVGVVKSLSDGVRAIAMGRYGEKVAVSAGGEIGELAESFNTMSVRIGEQDASLRRLNEDLFADIEARKETEKKLKESETKFKTLVERLPAATYMAGLDRSGAIIYMSPQAQEMFGYSLDEWIGTPGLWVRLLHPDDRQRVIGEYLKSIEDGRPFAADYRVVRKDGKVIWCRDEAVVLMDESGVPVFTEGFIFDITEYVQAEAERKQLEVLKETERINRELRDFAHIVSHDLKAPLRAISSLAGWIAEDHGDGLGPEGKEQVDMLLKRVRRMDDLIDGILRYSRVSREKKARGPVDTAVAAREAAEAVLNSAGVRLVIGEGLPIVHADPVQIGQVFQNLIGNAVKYIGRPDGIIEVGCRQDAGVWEFFVKDNGPGIEERHFERIFQIFQTLNARDDIESTGVGLSIVKKIVEQEGGRIWVESERGNGSTFYFTIPNIPAEPADAAPEAEQVHQPGPQ